MRVSKGLFMVGLVLLFIGIANAVLSASVERWEHKEQTFLERVLTVPAGLSLFPTESFLSLPEESKDIVVNGTVKELHGGTFNLYVFNSRNYQLWQANMPYQAYVEAKNISSYSMTFSPSREDVKYLIYFVAVNKNSVPGPDISVEYSIKISWDEKIHVHALSGLVLGSLFGGIGFLLIIVSYIVKVAFKRQDREKIIRPIEYCSRCGTVLTSIGVTGKSFCSKCKRLYD
jgi:uncharacterized membrane protein